MTEIRTQRLLLRQWQAADFAAFASLNADPDVMRYFPALLSRAESDAIALRCQELIAERGWGFWAAQVRQQLPWQCQCPHRGVSEFLCARPCETADARSLIFMHGIYMLSSAQGDCSQYWAQTLSA